MLAWKALLFQSFVLFPLPHSHSFVSLSLYWSRLSLFNSLYLKLTKLLSRKINYLGQRQGYFWSIICCSVDPPKQPHHWRLMSCPSGFTSPRTWAVGMDNDQVWGYPRIQLPFHMYCVPILIRRVGLSNSRKMKSLSITIYCFLCAKHSAKCFACKFSP